LDDVRTILPIKPGSSLVAASRIGGHTSIYVECLVEDSGGYQWSLRLLLRLSVGDFGGEQWHRWFQRWFEGLRKSGCFKDFTYFALARLQVIVRFVYEVSDSIPCIYLTILPLICDSNSLSEVLILKTVTFGCLRVSLGSLIVGLTFCNVSLRSLVKHSRLAFGQARSNFLSYSDNFRLFYFLNLGSCLGKIIKLLWDLRSIQWSLTLYQLNFACHIAAKFINVLFIQFKLFRLSRRWVRLNSGKSLIKRKGIPYEKTLKNCLFRQHIVL